MGGKRFFCLTHPIGSPSSGQVMAVDEDWHMGAITKAEPQKNAASWLAFLTLLNSCWSWWAVLLLRATLMWVTYMPPEAILMSLACAATEGYGSVSGSGTHRGSWCCPCCHWRICWGLWHVLTPEIMWLSVVCDVSRNYVQVHNLRASQPSLPVRGKGATYSMELMTEGTPEEHIRLLGQLPSPKSNSLVRKSSKRTLKLVMRMMKCRSPDLMASGVGVEGLSSL